MSRHEIGVDLVDIDRIVAVLRHHPERFRRRVLTEREDAYCGRKVERVAGRWAAKEAISKVLGLGVRGVGWREIEVLPNRAGQPQVILHRRAAERARSLGLAEVTVSISHERRMAVAVALAESLEVPERDERPDVPRDGRG
jgi:holo-[acyl-carrier protein] synthase